MADKNYVGKGKVWGDYGCINISLKADQLEPNEKGYVNLTVGKMRKQDDYGNTHTVWVNDWKPQQRQEPSSVEDELAF